jgi:flagella basal body P-ring formation protein FlgA
MHVRRAQPARAPIFLRALAVLALSFVAASAARGARAQAAAEQAGAQTAAARGLDKSGADRAAETSAYLTPSVAIYPKQVIRAEMVETRLTAAKPPGGIALSFDDVLGKASRATLVPGRPIPLAALGEPELVRAGSVLTLSFSEGGLDIRAAGVALQPGAAGERIRARNSATGVTVLGTLRGDGVLVVESGL